MKRIKLARINADLSQAELAEKVGVKDYIISRYETGVSKPDIEKLGMIADALGVTTDYLLDRKTKETLPFEL
jgi:transcriptional regulator with XRE-family HTH domain